MAGGTIVLSILAGYGLLTVYHNQPPGMSAFVVLPPALVALGIAGLVAAHSRRRVTPADVLRITCWTVVGGGLGAVAFADPVRTLAWSAIVGAMLIIILSMILLPLSPVEKPGHCSECGYSLKGLDTPRCPECGTPFDPDSLA